MPTTGTDLRVERARARVTVKALAERMRLSRQTLWTLERAESVNPDRAREYLAALETFREDDMTEKVPA